jgi:gliding motility-associated-like protein
MKLIRKLYFYFKFKHHKTVVAVVFLFGLIIFNSEKATATHAAGADLTYRCLGGMVYQIDATFYRDCGGTPEPGNVTITYKSGSCSYSRSSIANKLVQNNGEEITLPCVTSPSSCNGGFSTGLRKWVYRTTVTLPFACNDWVFSFRVCCRNCTVTTIQTPCASNSELYVEATLNNVVAACNNSPQFSRTPIAFVCLGQNFNYNQGVYDIDGDSLAYELITPKTSAIAEITWMPPASQQQPLASSTPFIINPQTGDINFTPIAMQIGILAVRVNEFRNGVFVGSTIRDMQVYTQNCFNTIPFVSGINNSNNYSGTACVGEPLCFTLNTSDVDSIQNLTLSYTNIPAGAVVTEVAGSRPSLQICWTPVASDISRIPKVFTVTVRDNSCPYNGIQTFSYAITVGGPSIFVSSTIPSCIGSSNATATVSGTGLNTILWNTTPVQTGNIASGLPAGNYEVLVTDQAGCSVTEQFQIMPSSNTVVVDAIGSGVITCQSGNVATGQVNIISGTAPYTYLWSTGEATPAISNLGVGIYSVTVSDANGCSTIDTLSIVQAAGNISVSLISTANNNCYGSNSGIAEVAAAGGSTPYTYLWSNGSNSAIAQNLTVGNYSVLVTDANGCTASLSTSITQPQFPLTHQTNSINVKCKDGSDGEIITNVSGGTSPYSYSWSNGATTPTISNLIAGLYTLTITDSNGCTIVYSENISEPVDSLISITTVLGNVLCFDGNNGSAQVSVTGGTQPYTYLWNNGASNAVNNNLVAGNYSSNITDGNGCHTSSSTLVIQPEFPITLLVGNVSNIVCGLGSGAVDISAFGGTAPLQYLWNTGAISEDLSGLQPGFYTVTVTDVNGCSQQTSTEVKNIGSAISIVPNHIQDVLCFNMSNGIIDLSVNGGNSPYTYLWNNGATSSHIQNLSAGTYSVTVTDVNGCNQTADYIIIQPASPLITVASVTQPLPCAIASSGSIALQISGGVTPYSFSWSNGATTQNLNSLTGGIYSVTVTDANGCNAIVSAEVTATSSVLAGTVVVLNPVSCFGGSNGAAICNIAGGSGNYSYQWSNGATTASVNGLSSGSYSVTATDISGCTYTETILIHQPIAPLSITGTTFGADCLSGLGGTIQTAVLGGTSPYNYSWSNTAITSTITNVNPGAYSVIVTDANNCTTTKDFNVENISTFNLTASGPLTICAGEMVTVMADSTMQGALQWYFNGNILNGATSSNFTTPAAGIYSATLINNCGTFTSDSLEVIVKSIDNVSISNAQIICPPETATLFATGGTNYSWSPASYITFTNVPDPIVSPQVTTLYSVEISNQFGCKTTLNTNVAVVCDSLFVPTGFSPNEDGVNDGYVIDGIEGYPGNKLWVYNRYGKLVYKATDYTNSWDGISNISGLYKGKKVPTGTYFYILDLNDRSKPRAGYLIIRH